MTKTWRLADLDFKKAKEYISSQDPDVSLRFVLPIPNWMDCDSPSVEHEQIQQVLKKETLQWRYVFENKKDGAQQGVKIDGSSAIIFMGLDKSKAGQLATMIAEYKADAQEFSPEEVTEIVERAERELGAVDRFNKDLQSIGRFFHPYEAEGQLGAFLPKPNHSSALYIAGEGEYLDGPTLTPQQFSNGAFINFPGVRLSEIFKLGAEAEGRLVQADVFLRDRTLPDGAKVQLNCVPSQ